MKNKQKIIFIYRYFRQKERISGMSGFLEKLVESLSKKADITIIAEGKEDEKSGGVYIKRFRKNFLVESAKYCKKKNSDFIVLASLFENIHLLLLYSLIFKIVSGKRLILLQGTILKNKWLKRLVFGFFDKIICISPSIYMQLKSKKSYYIPPGINLMEIKKIKAAKKTKLRIGFFGHIIPSKGADILVEMFIKSNIDAELVLAGGGLNYEKTSHLKERIIKKTKKKKNIIIKGYLNNVKEYIKSCDIVVFPYRSSSLILGLSITAIEAMTMERPVIISDVDCLAPLIDNKINGYIYKNKEELKDLLIYLSKNEKVREKIGKKAGEKVKNNFDIEKISRKWIYTLKDG